jgi:hypothetical protein
MLNYMHRAETVRKLVQISLVGEPGPLNAIVAPFKATFGPPPEASKSVVVTPKRNPSNIINAKPP